MSAQLTNGPSAHRWRRLLKQRSTYAMLGLLVLWTDVATGPFLQFPILFVVPVALGAWHCSGRLGYSLAVLLPLGRLATAGSVEVIDHPGYLLANALIRVLVLGFIAFLAARASYRQQALESRVNEFATMCAWSRTIEYNGEWLSFEQYLERRFGQKTTHGLSPEAAERLVAAAHAAAANRHDA